MQIRSPPQVRKGVLRPAASAGVVGVTGTAWFHHLVPAVCLLVVLLSLGIPSSRARDWAQRC